MIEILIKPFTYIFLIVAGYILKTTKIVKAEDANTLGVISFSLLLPLAIISSFRGFEFEYSLILVVIGSFLLNVFLGIMGKIVSRNKSKQWQAVYLLNNSSYNIGSLVLPFIITVFEPKYLIYMSMFDVGNAMYSMGLNYALAESTLNNTTTFSFKSFMGKLVSSMPFMTYVCLLVLVNLGIILPDVLFDVAGSIGQANVIIVMIMFGVLLEFDLSKEVISNSLHVLAVRYGFATLSSLVVSFILPLPMEAKKVLVLCLFSPMTSAVATYCMKLGIKQEKYGLINAISMPISIAILTILTIIWL